MAHLYWADPGSRLLPGVTVSLSGDEARHAAKVGRLRLGEKVLVGDGHGRLVTAEATTIGVDRVELVVIDALRTFETAPECWLVQSLAKSGRDEAAIEMATEVGVTGVIPLSTSRTVVQWRGEKADTARQRWQRIVREAAKQSLTPLIPEVRPLLDISGLIAEAPEWRLVVLDHRAQSTLDQLSWTSAEMDRPIAIVVGPEGGFSDDERRVLIDAGAELARLGPGVLRASTAGPVALALVHQLLGHWSAP